MNSRHLTGAAIELVAYLDPKMVSWAWGNTTSGSQRRSNACQPNSVFTSSGAATGKQMARIFNYRANEDSM